MLKQNGHNRAAVVEALESRVLLSYTVPSDYVLVETKSISATSSTIKHFSTPLSPGWDYIVEAEGTAKIGDRNDDDGGPRNTDATKFDDWTETNVFSRSQPARLEFSGLSSWPGWGDYQSDHVYGQMVTASGSVLGVRFNDQGYTDNGGALTVKLYAKIPDFVNSTGSGGDIDSSDDTAWTGGFNSEGVPEVTLHSAIDFANAKGGQQTIVFNIPSSDPGQYTINASGLPQITDALAIDGTSQPGYGGDAPIITLSGGSPALDFSAEGNFSVNAIAFQGAATGIAFASGSGTATFEANGTSE